MAISRASPGFRNCSFLNSPFSVGRLVRRLPLQQPLGEDFLGLAFLICSDDAGRLAGEIETLRAGYKLVQIHFIAAVIFQPKG